MSWNYSRLQGILMWRSQKETESEKKVKEDGICVMVEPSEGLSEAAAPTQLWHTLATAVWSKQGTLLLETHFRRHWRFSNALLQWIIPFEDLKVLACRAFYKDYHLIPLSWCTIPWSSLARHWSVTSPYCFWWICNKSSSSTFQNRTPNITSVPLSMNKSTCQLINM